MAENIAFNATKFSSNFMSTLKSSEEPTLKPLDESERLQLSQGQGEVVSTNEVPLTPQEALMNATFDEMAKTLMDVFNSGLSHQEIINLVSNYKDFLAQQLTEDAKLLFNQLDQLLTEQDLTAIKNASVEVENIKKQIAEGVKEKGFDSFEASGELEVLREALKAAQSKLDQQIEFAFEQLGAFISVLEQDHEHQKALYGEAPASESEDSNAYQKPAGRRLGSGPSSGGYGSAPKASAGHANPYTMPSLIRQLRLAGAPFFTVLILALLRGYEITSAAGVVKLERQNNAQEASNLATQINKMLMELKEKLSADGVSENFDFYQFLKDDYLAKGDQSFIGRYKDILETSGIKIEDGMKSPQEFAKMFSGMIDFVNVRLTENDASSVAKIPQFDFDDNGKIKYDDLKQDISNDIRSADQAEAEFTTINNKNQAAVNQYSETSKSYLEWLRMAINTFYGRSIAPQ